MSINALPALSLLSLLLWCCLVLQPLSLVEKKTSTFFRCTFFDRKMAFAIGKWKLTTTDNFDEYMKALGVGLVTRKMANSATPVQEITQTGDEINIKTTTTFKTTEIKFKLGEEFEEHTADGRTVKTTVTQDGNKLIQSQKGEKDTTLVREFNGDDMKMVLTVDDIVCTRCYKKIE